MVSTMKEDDKKKKKGMVVVIALGGKPPKSPEKTADPDDKKKMDDAWQFLKEERQYDSDHIYIEDFGYVPKQHYYNAEWWWNHPHEHINSVRDEVNSVEELQGMLNAERGE